MIPTTIQRSGKTDLIGQEEAEQILVRGTDLLDPRLARSFPKLPGNEVPPLRIDANEVRRAKALGHSLVLMMPVTAEVLHNATGNQLVDGGKLLYSDWAIKPEQKFGVEETQFRRPTWAFMAQAPIPETTSCNFLVQTQARAKYLAEQVYGEQALPRIYQEAIAELRDREKTLAKLMEDDWQKANKELSALRINQLCCPTYSALLYHWCLHLAINGERLYGQIYSWTRSLSADGELVGVGGFGSGGAGVNGWSPREAIDNVGVIFSAGLEAVK